MKRKGEKFTGILVVPLLLVIGGCQQLQLARQFYVEPPPPVPLGTTVDLTLQAQQENAEASDFVVYQHEFVVTGQELNSKGQNHLMEIAFRLQQGQDFPVVVERSRTNVREGTAFKYPVHPNVELDRKRRQVVVAALEQMGVTAPENRVVVAPAYAPGMHASEASSAYQRGIRSFGSGFFGGGLGGGFGLGGGGLRF